MTPIEKEVPVVGLQELPILVAEDDDTNYRLMDVFLKLNQKKHVRAANGLEALELAKKQKFSVILMDLKMPNMDGVEATRLIREFDKETPIIACTAHTSEEKLIAAREAGCNDILMKPVKRDELMHLIESYIK